jgi:predicted Zn-dependent peptidase
MTSSAPKTTAAPIEKYSKPRAKLLTAELEKPSLDDRAYRVIQLPNKLEALLVHDGDTDKASAAMDVYVGSYSDRDDMLGMAHAVEHLLLMGTEKVGPGGCEWTLIQILSNSTPHSTLHCSCGT